MPGRSAGLALLGGVLIVSSAALAGGEIDVFDNEALGNGHRQVTLVGTSARVAAFEREGRITRLYGEAFSHGATPEESAQAFLAANAGVLGIDAADLVPAEGLESVPVMYDRATGHHKFTVLNFRQVRDGVPVFRSLLRLVVRNEPGHPLVLASADVRSLDGFDLQLNALPPIPVEAAYAAAAEAMPGVEGFENAELAIWAGVDHMFVEPRLAWIFEATIGQAGLPAGDYRRELFVVDARTNEVLHEENRILHLDVNGTTGGQATLGNASDACEPEAYEPLPYVRVNIGASVSYADANGNYVIDNLGSTPVTVEARIMGQWFDVNNQAGSDLVLSQSVTPPGPADFTFNAANSSEFERAQVNGYLQSNVVRDYVLYYVPNYPTIGNQGSFPVNVNIASTCNAYYDGASINFYRAGGGCPNTAYTSVVYHEYGHHLVNVGGSGQGAYGEGMGDVMGVLITDDPGLGYGFQGGCSTPLRSADNNCQYSASTCTTNCGSAIHDCGRLISGCVWDLRNELFFTNPSNYRDIVSSLAISSILVHAGTSIDPSITIDYLTLDDDDSTIFNGTPHYAQIAAAFGAHSMPAPALPLLAFEFPAGLPQTVSPSGATTIPVVVEALTGQPQPGTGTMFIDFGSGLMQIPMSQIAPNQYEVTFPAAACGTLNSFYFRAQATNGQFVLWPVGAPTTRFSAISATGLDTILVENFEATGLWTTQNVNITGGAWQRGVPAGFGDRGDPTQDADGSGACWLTENAPGNTDVDGGPTRLISPSWDLSAYDNPAITFSEWFTNDDQDIDRLTVELSNNGGATWTQVLSIAGHNGWQEHTIYVSEHVVPSASTRIRFNATDNPNDSVTEGGIDGLRIVNFVCSNPCPADVDESGGVDFNDLLQLLAAWGPCGGCPSDIDGTGAVDFNDLLQLLAAWGPCS